jgi:hypothetical protein
MRARILLCLLFAPILVTGATPAEGQTFLPRGPWVPTWTVVYGGYRQVEGMAASGGAVWGVDYSVVTGPTGQVGQTAFVKVESGVWRAAQIVQGASLQSVALAGDKFGMAVGLSGAIYGYGGRLWAPVASPTREELVDVALSAPDNGWAVGERATVLHWDGREWTPQATPVQGSRLTAVEVTPTGEAWVTSLGGQILHYDGQDWTVADAPLLQQAADVAFASPTYGMAVGRNVLLYQNGAWHAIDAPEAAYQSVAFWQDTAYVVGDTRLYRYLPDGTWEAVPLADVTPAVADKPFVRVARAPDGVWAFAGDGATLLLRDDGATYVRPELKEAWALDMVTTDFGWAGGLAGTAAFVGVSGQSAGWTLQQAAPADTFVHTIDLVSATDGWAVGADPAESPQAHMWRWDGQHWNDWPVEKTWQIADIDMIDANEGWASKGNVVVRWDGREWSQVRGAPPNASAGGLAMLRGGPDPEGWFGAYGGMYHLEGDTWTPITLTNQALIVDIEVPDPTEGWAISDKALYRYDGETWSQVPLPLSPRSTLYDVDAPERDNAWILSDPDGLYHWNGTDWERHDLSPFGDAFQPLRLRALRLEPDSLATDVWLVGLNPSIGRYRVVVPVGTVFLPAVDRGFVR